MVSQSNSENLADSNFNLIHDTSSGGRKRLYLVLSIYK